jgi:hypothetical protein
MLDLLGAKSRIDAEMLRFCSRLGKRYQIGVGRVRESLKQGLVEAQVPK